MTVTQTIDIPANRRIILEVPHEVPTGPAILVFKQVKAKKQVPNSLTMAALHETSEIMSGKKKVKWNRFQPDTTREEAKDEIKKTLGS